MVQDFVRTPKWRISPDANIVKLSTLYTAFRKDKKRFPDLGTVDIPIEDKDYELRFLEHIKIIFKLSDLSSDLKDTLRYLSLMPKKGIPAIYFCQWTGSSQENLNLLTQMGYVINSKAGEYALHSLILKVILTELVPAPQNCLPLINSLQKPCRTPFVEKPMDPVILDTIESVTANITPEGSISDHQAFISMIEFSLPYFQFQRSTRWRPMIDKLGSYMAQTEAALKEQNFIFYVLLYIQTPYPTDDLKQKIRDSFPSSESIIAQSSSQTSPFERLCSLFVTQDKDVQIQDILLGYCIENWNAPWVGLALVPALLYQYQSKNGKYKTKTLIGNLKEKYKEHFQTNKIQYALE